MHMTDSLLSPAVGCTMWAVTVGAAAYSARKIRQDTDESKVPLMGVLGAFVFAAQMINFSIPGTGSSGHLGGGLLLAILLGPYAGFLTVASILTVQALFFADGGLLALGCNIFNMGFITCFLAYPLLYKPLAGKTDSKARIFTAALVAAIAGLQAGAFGVVIETLLSGISALPFKTFVLLMQPIHLAIGVVEGLVTAAVTVFLRNTRAELLDGTVGVRTGMLGWRKKILIALAVSALAIGGALSWFASTHPDGLEWSIFHATGREELAATDQLHGYLARIQEKTAFLPDYGFKHTTAKAEPAGNPSWPAVSGETSIAGIVGGVVTLLLVYCLGLLLRLVHKREQH